MNVHNLETVQYCNYLAISLLEHIGNLNPTQQEIECVESKVFSLIYWMNNNLIV